jgi:cell wall-associated NlpC family hydrolase
MCGSCMLRRALMKFCPSTVEVSSYRGCKPLANLWLSASAGAMRIHRYNRPMGSVRAPKTTVMLAVTLAALSAACASTGGTPRPFPMPGPHQKASPPDVIAPKTSSTMPADEYALVGTALDLRGVPYKNGGADRSGFDCSGFTQYVFAQYGLSLPRAVRDQFKAGIPVALEKLEPGDLIFFATTDPGASHVAIAVGADEFVHAPSSTGVVRVERLSSTYWATRFLGGRRLLSN